jgi:formate hydrogenlyase subunit 6/NADH:ubiquinone oxidoreductase subunit I
MTRQSLVNYRLGNRKNEDLIIGKERKKAKKKKGKGKKEERERKKAKQRKRKAKLRGTGNNPPYPTRQTNSR